MKETVCVFDIDDTSYEFSNPLVDLHNKLFGTRISPTQLTKWDFENLILTDVDGNIVRGSDLRSTMIEYIDNGLLASLEPKKFTKEAIDICKVLGYKVVFLTARSINQRKQTTISLLKYNILHDSVIFQKDKVWALKELSEHYNIELFVDDNVKYLNDCVNLSFIKKNYVINCPHNTNEYLDPRVIRVNNLMDVVCDLKRIK